MHNRETVARSYNFPWARLVAVALLAPVLSLFPVAHAQALAASGSAFHSLYGRLVNTETGVGGSSAPFGSNEERSYGVLGTDGVPSSGVSAVLIDVAVMKTTGNAAGIRAFPTGGTAPTDAQLKYDPTQTPVSATMAVAVGTNGKITIKVGSAGTDINVDLQGYFSSTGTQGFVPMTATRLIDTSTGTGIAAAEIASGSTHRLTLDPSVVPADATAVFASIDVTSISGDGFLSVGTTAAAADAAGGLVNFDSGGPDVMGASIPLNSDSFYLYNGSATGDVNIGIDVEGYFTSSGGGFTPVSQADIYSSGAAGFTADDAISLQVGGTNGLPSDGVAGAVLTVTVSGFTDNGGLSLTPTGDEPGRAQLNFNSSNNVIDSSTIVVRPGLDGDIDLQNNSDSDLTVVISLQGWFAAPPVVPANQQAAFISLAEQNGYSADWANEAIYVDEMADDILDSPTDSDSMIDPSGDAVASTGDDSGNESAELATASHPSQETVSGRFVNGVDSGVPGLPVDVYLDDTVPDDGSSITATPIASATTDDTGNWTITLPSNLSDAAQTYADNNGGVLNLVASVIGDDSASNVYAGFQALSVNVGVGSTGTESMAGVETTSDPAAKTAEVAPVADEADHNYVDNADDTPIKFNPYVIGGRDYSAAVPNVETPYNDTGTWCVNTENLLGKKVQKVAIAETHAYWNATSWVDYNDTMSSTVTVSFSVDGGEVASSGFTLAGGSGVSSEFGFETRHVGPHRANMVLIPILFEKVSWTETCRRNSNNTISSQTTTAAEVKPVGYHLEPKNSATYFFGRNVTALDGPQAWADRPNPNSNRGYIPAGSEAYLGGGESQFYSAGFTVFGFGLEGETEYDSHHQQIIHAGKDTGRRHYFWGANGSTTSSAGTLLSY